VAAPYTQGNSLRNHDIAIMNWLSGLHVDYGTDPDGLSVQQTNVPILSVFSTPDRAYAEIVDLLARKRWITGSTYDEMKANAAKIEALPLPIVTVVAGEPAFDPEMVGVPKKFANRTAPGIGPGEPYPGHYRREYTVNFWSRRRSTDNFIREWVMSQFGIRGCAFNERLIPVDHGEPHGTWLQSLKHLGGADQSDLEGEEVAYKRVEYSFSLRFWLMRANTTL